MASKKIVAAVLALCVAAGLGYVYVSDRQAAGDALKIYGSVDMRTVDLAFEESGRIGQVSVEEGDTVKAGDVLAKLDDERYAIALENARATLQVRQKELDLLLAGSRVEEIDAARATLQGQCRFGRFGAAHLRARTKARPGDDRTDGRSGLLAGARVSGPGVGRQKESRFIACGHAY